MHFQPEHLGLAATDPVSLKDWYVRVLGARLLTQLAQSPPAFMLEFHGGLWLEIYAAESDGLLGNKIAGWRHLALRVANIESARDHLSALGVRFEEPIKPAGGAGRILFFSDPEGNLLHFVERPPGWQP